MGIYHQPGPGFFLPPGTIDAVDQPQWVASHLVDASGITFADSTTQTTAFNFSTYLLDQTTFTSPQTVSNYIPHFDGGTAGAAFWMISQNGPGSVITSIALPPNNPPTIFLFNNSAFTMTVLGESLASGGGLLLTYTPGLGFYTPLTGPSSPASFFQYPTAGTYTPAFPAGASIGYAILVGAGGGAGAGASYNNTTTTKGGGNGGNTGCVSIYDLTGQLLQVTSITVGAGGAGAPGQTTVNADGAAGTAGGDTTLTFSNGVVYKAKGGAAGLGGTSGAAVAQTAPTSGGNFALGLPGGTGGIGGGTATAGASTPFAPNSEYLSSAGGGGAGLTTANAGERSGAGGDCGAADGAGWGAGTANVGSGSNGRAGNPGFPFNSQIYSYQSGSQGGSGGGAGTGVSGTGGGKGGDGGGSGASGAGGGANRSATGVSGAGGNGSDGLVMIVVLG